MFLSKGKVTYLSQVPKKKQTKPLQKFSSFFKAEPVHEDMIKVILLLQVSSHDFEPTLLYFV
jgi:hypothetical protein